MFQVNKPAHVNKTFRMPKELVNPLQMVAQQKDISLNALVEQCCAYALEHLDTQ